MARALSRLRKIEGLPIILVFALLLALFMYTAPQVFLQPFIYTTFLSTLPPLVLLAVGLTFVIGAGEIDLSFPAIISFSGFVFAVLFKEYGLGWLAVVAGLASGLLVGRAERHHRRPDRHPVVHGDARHPVLLGGHGDGAVGRQVLRAARRRGELGLAVDRRPPLRRVGGDLDRAAADPGAVDRASSSCSCGSSSTATASATACSSSATSNAVSRVVGIDVEREKIKIFTLMGGLAGMAAIMLTLENKNYFGNQGQGYLLTAIASVLIGGTSIFGGRATIVGTVFGCFIIGMIEAGLVATGLTGAWVRTVQGLVFLIAVISYLYIEEPQRRSAFFARLRPSKAFGRARAAE